MYVMWKRCYFLEVNQVGRSLNGKSGELTVHGFDTLTCGWRGRLRVVGVVVFPRYRGVPIDDDTTWQCIHVSKSVIPPRNRVGMLHTPRIFCSRIHAGIQRCVVGCYKGEDWTKYCGGGHLLLAE